jgi:hypothetical protein
MLAYQVFRTFGNLSTADNAHRKKNFTNMIATAGTIQTIEETLTVGREIELDVPTNIVIDATGDYFQLTKIN